MPQRQTTQNLAHIANQCRLEVLELVHRGKCGHIGGDFSCMEVLVCLYFGMMDCQQIKEGAPDRDRFILSKGHSAEALYTVLAHAGVFDPDELESYGRFGTQLAGHPTKGLPGVEFATGALGHGLPVAVGMALAMKKDGVPRHVWVLMGDGEQAEGSIWEAAMAAAKFGLDNLTAIVDRNRLQISGSTEDVMPLGDLAAKYRAFGFETMECDGHDPESLLQALSFRAPGKPAAVIANTVKGYGSGILANKAVSHHLVPDDIQYSQIKTDLLKRLEGA